MLVEKVLLNCLLLVLLLLLLLLLLVIVDITAAPVLYIVGQ